MKKITKIISVILLIAMLLTSLSTVVKAETQKNQEIEVSWVEYALDNQLGSKTEFSPYVLLGIFNLEDATGYEGEIYTNKLLKYASESNLTEENSVVINDEMLNFDSKDGKKGDIKAFDATFILTLSGVGNLQTRNNYVSDLKNALIEKENIKAEDIKIVSTTTVTKEIFDFMKNTRNIEFADDYYVFDNTNTFIANDSTTQTQADKALGALKVFEDKCKEIPNNKEEILPHGSRYMFVEVRATAETPNATKVYDLTLGKDQNWYWVLKSSTPKKEETKEFVTELTYTAKIGDKEIKGSFDDKTNTYIPGYDKDQIEKDADVTATITSKNDMPILEVNGVKLTEDGKPNKLGWYYIDAKDKRVIAKIYPFDVYDNLKDVGNAKEDVELTSEDSLKDTQKVKIKWPFRIIEDKQDPEKVTKDTKTVTRTITTNLPMDEGKLPDGWKFTDDEEGKTQHRIYKVYNKDDGDVKETVVVTRKGDTDTDKTNVEIKWEKDDTIVPSKIPQTGGTIVVAALAVISLVLCIVSYRKFKK